MRDDEPMKKRNIFVAFCMVLLLCAAGVQMASAQPIAVEKTAAPDMIYVRGSGDTPDLTTVTIMVAGDSGEEALPMDVVFGIDSSNSMSWNDPSGLRRDAAIYFVNKLNDGVDQGGVVYWDSHIHVDNALDYDMGNVIAGINSYDYDPVGWTDINLGLATCIANLDANTRSGESVKVIIFLTDGINTAGPGYDHAQAVDAAAKGYKIFGIGLQGQDPVAEADLQDMAETTGGAFFIVTAPEDLQLVYDQIFTLINRAPDMVNIVEVTEDYIVDEGSFSIAPDSVVENPDGTTTITWNNVATSVGDADDYLEAGETFTVTFVAGSDTPGIDLPIEVIPGAVVNYERYAVGPLSTPIPQAYLDVIKPAIAVDKTADDYSIYRGDTVTYTYEVTNAGNIELSGITLTDDKVSPVYVSGDDGNGLLDLTETWIYTATAAPTNTITNTATVKGTDPLGKVVSATDSVTVVVTVRVSMDIKPGSCPNAFNMNAKGVLPIALLGGVASYTLDEIDFATIRLNNVAPIRYTSEDVATPYLEPLCGCHELTGDGFTDLSLKFDNPSIAPTLGNPDKGDQLTLTLTGTLNDGITFIEGQDCVLIQKA